jgi:hypothetical protein
MALIQSDHHPGQSLADRARPARRLVEGTRFVGILKRIIAGGVPVEIRHPTYPTITVFPQDNAFGATNEVLALAGMFRASSMTFTTRILTDDAAAAALSGDRCQPLGRLLYSSALFGSEGRLLLNVDPGEKLRLTNWPDFDALPHLPEHRKIASFMLVNSADIIGISAATGADIAIVIDFCNACEAVGLLRRMTSGPADRAADDRSVSQLIGRMRRLFRET